MKVDAHTNITLYDVSRHSGVSIATVSRVINKSPLVKESTRIKVNASMRELGFRPSHAARALAGHQTKTMGVILPDISSGFYAQVLKGIDLELANHDYHVLTTFSHNLEDEKTLSHRILYEQRTDALILMNLELPDTFIQELSGYDIPLVLLDRPSRLQNISSVSINNDQGIDRILDYLSNACGYRTLGIVTGPAGTYDADQRLSACRKKASSYGLRILEDFVADGDFSYEKSHALMHQWIERRVQLPDAVIALNDSMAIGCVNACRERDVHIPEQLGIVGFDDIESAQFLGLTTVQVPLVEMGTRAAELALSACSGETPLQHVLLDTSLIVRTSCKSRTS